MEQIVKIAEIFKAFSDPTRLKILRLLVDHKFLCVNAITRKLDVTQSAVSQHLRILRQADLVINERMSNQIHYSLNREKLAEFNEWVSKVLGKDLYP